MTVEDRGIVAPDVAEDVANSFDGGVENQTDEIVVAQADPVPLPDTSGASDGAQASFPTEITPDESNTVQLPAGVSIEELRLDGADIVLVQPDGTEIRIVNAALNIPTFVIDGIEVPQEVLVAVLGENGINVAAGPEGQLSVVGPGPQGSGANFNDGDGDGDGDGGPGVLGLLQGTELGGGENTEEQVTDGSGIAPTISAGGDTGILVESDDVPNGVDAEPVPATGTLTFFDPDFGETRTAEISGRTVVASNIFHGPTLTAAQIDALLAGFTLDSAATGGVTTEPSAAGNGTIDWTYTVANALIDFLAAGETVVLDFVVTISDGINTVATTVQITVVGTNDIPVFTAADATVIDEEAVLADGNDGDSYGPGGEDVDPNPLPPFEGSLNITWGPDDYSDNAQTVVNGDVTFTNIVSWSNGTPLTSRGEDITTTVSDGGATITGTAGGRTVFIATVDEQGNGAYTFELLDVLDHPGENAEDSVSLTFGLNVTDSNAFSQAHSFTVTINDDAPELNGSMVELTAAENDIFNFRSQGSSPGSQEAGVDSTSEAGFSALELLGGGFASTMSGTVAGTVDFGADGAASGGGFGFASNAVSTLDGLDLTSKGGDVVFAQVGDALIGYVDGTFFGFPTPGFQPVIDRPVMSLQLNDDGSFTFRLYDQLDHLDDGNNDESSELANGLAAIDFGAVIEATDGDGDAITLDGKLLIAIKDDVPSASINLTANTVTHDETAGPNPGETNSSQVANLFNAYGAAIGYARADLVNTSVTEGADDNLSGVMSLRIIGDGTTDLSTADGAIVLLMEGNLMVGRDAAGDLVFALHIDSQGRVSIAQYKAIEHPDANDPNDIADLDGFVEAVVTVTDHDGDTATDSVDIGANIRFVDDAPVAGGPAVELVAAENDIFNFRSQGSSPGSQEAGVDSTSEAGFSALELLGGGFASTMSGTVAGTVDFGADGAASGGGFGFASNAVSTLDGLDLTSKGGDVVFAQVGDALIGYVDGTFFGFPTPGFQPVIDRPVMSLQLNDDGSFTFRLYDQLDHLDDGNNDESSELANGLAAIDFGAVIEATDGDGDAITLDGKLLIAIKDDVPQLSDADPIERSINEGTAAPLNGTLADQIVGGADDNVRFNIEMDDLDPALLSLTSGGHQVDYTLSGNSLVATANGQPVFTFTVNPNTGAYSFLLQGPIDHFDKLVIGVVPIVPADSLDAPGDTHEVTEVDGNDLAFVGRLSDDDAIIRVTNDGNDEVEWVLGTWTPGGPGGTFTPVQTLTIPAHTTVFVNVGALNGQFRLEDGPGNTGDSAPGGNTNVNPGHGDTIVEIDGDEELTLDLSSAVTVRDNDGDELELEGRLLVTVNDSVPVAVDIGQSMEENDSPSFSLVPPGGFGADGPGTIMLGTATLDSSDVPIAFDPLIVELVGTDVQFTSGAIFDPLAVGQTATVLVPFTITDADGDTSSGVLTITVTGTNDAPVITSGNAAATIAEPGDIAGINEAGLTNPSVPSGAPGLEPFITLPAAVTSQLSLVLTVPETLDTVLANVHAELGGTLGQAIAVVWDYLDDIYVSAGSAQKEVNHAFVRLGLAYADALQNGTVESLLDVVAKYTPDNGDADDLPQRVQSLHDNLLGNVTSSALNQRFGPTGATPDSGLHDDLTDAVELVDAGLLGRPYYEGSQGEDVSDTRDFDIAHGLVPAATGQMTADDVDASDTLTWSDATGASGAFGTFTIDAATGEWSYVLTPGAVDALGVGDFETEVFTVEVSDGNGGTANATVTITITGTNDAPVIEASSDVTGSVIEAGDIAGVQEAGPTGGLSHGFTITADLASLGIDADAAAFADVYADVLADVGGDDAAAIAVLWQYLDSQYPTTTGHLDHPINEAFVRLGAHYAGLLASGQIGPLTEVVAKYTADNNGSGAPDRLQSLHDNLLGNLKGTVIDGRFDTLETELKTLVDGIDGVIDPASDALLERTAFSGNEIGTSGTYNTGATYDANNGIVAKATGTIDASDVDLGDNLTFTGNAVTAYGSFTIDPVTGEWTYVLNQAAADSLGEGDNPVETFTVTVEDEHGAIDTVDVTVTITGTNDAPVIEASSDVTGSVIEAGDIAGVQEAGPTGGLSHGFTITADLASLGIDADAAAFADVYADVLADVGGDDAAAIAVLWQYLDSQYPTTTGHLDHPINEAFVRLGAHYAGLLASGQIGPLTEVVAKYTADNNGSGAPDRLQSLHDNLLGNLKGTVIDGRFDTLETELKTLVDGIDGVIDPASDALLERTAFSGNEIGTSGTYNTGATYDANNGIVAKATGTIDASDVDLGDNLTFTGNAVTAYGSFTIDPVTGEWTYVLNQAAADSLGEGDNPVETFTVTVADGLGGSATIDVTITINGTNDAPHDIELSGDAIPASAGAGFVVGAVTVSDVDSNSFSFEVTNPDGSPNADLAVVEVAPGSYELQTTGFVTTLPAGITITADDGDGGTYSETFAITLPVELRDASDNLIASFSTLKAAVDFANADAGTDFNIHMASGDIALGGQVVIEKNISITGEGIGQTTLNADFDTSSNHNDDSGALIVVADGYTGNFSGFDFDGTGHQVMMAIRHLGNGAVDEVHFANIIYGASAGTGISVRGDANVDVLNSVFTNIGRIGAHFRDADVVGRFEDNHYTGKGAGNHLEYAAEASSGAEVDFVDNFVTGNLGQVNANDTAAGFLVTTYFGLGTVVTFTGNTVENSYEGIAIGYPGIGPSGVPDESDVTFGAGNDFTNGVGTGVVVVGNATATGTQQVDGTFDWTGAEGNNEPSGADLSDVLRGGGGNDAITGFDGDDTLDGGTGIDTAHYTASLTAGDIVSDGAGNWTVTTGTSEGTDTITNMEIVDGTEAGKFLLVGNGGFATIQAAVDAAVDGDTVIIAEGTWSGAGNENVIVDKAITLIGAGAVTIDAAGSAYGFDVNLDSDSVSGTVRFENLTVVNAASAGIKASDGTILGTLELDNVELNGNAAFGLYVSGRTDTSGNAGGGFNQAGVQALVVTNSSFDGNGAGGTNGSGDIVLFEFDGDATFSGVTITGSTGGASNTAIQISGFDASGFQSTLEGAPTYSYDVLTPMGTVIFENVSITGGYSKLGLYIQGFTDTTGLEFRESTTNPGQPGTVINVNAGWGAGLGIDPMADQFPSGTAGTPGNAGSFFNEANADGSVDLTFVSVTDADGGINVFVDGTSKADSITATGNSDFITGFGGDDTIDGGSGADAAGFNGTFDSHAVGFDTVAGTITVTDNDAVTDGNDGTDSLTDVETLVFKDAVVHIVDLNGQFGAFTSIQAAVDAASANDVIMVIGRADYTDSVNVDKALSFIGVDVGAGKPEIAPATGSAFKLSGDFGVGSTVLIDGFTITDPSRSGIEALGDVTLGTLKIENTDISGAAYNGVEINGAAIGNTEITDSDFAGNGNRLAAGGGAGDIMFFQYNGDASLTGLQLTGDWNGVDGPNTGIQFRSDTGAMGTVSFDDVTIDGAYRNQPIGIFNYDSVDGLTMADVTVNADSVAFGTAINFDGITGDIDFSDAAKFNNVQVPGTATAPLANDPVSLQGDDAGQSLTGNDEAEFIRAFGGDDTLRGNGGNDVLLGNDRTGAADSDVDTAEFSGAFADYTVSFGDFDIGFGSIPGFTIGGPDGTDLVGQIEVLVFDNGGSPQTVRVVGAGGYDNIQAAVDAAADGDIILIAPGTYAGNVTVDKALTFIGTGSGHDPAVDTIIDGGGFIVDLTADAVGGMVSFQNLAVINAPGAGISSQDQQVLGTLHIDGVRVEDAGGSGIIASGRQASGAYAQAGVQNVEITNSFFIDNAQSSGNSANIMLFEFDGDATITNVNAINNVGGPNSAAFGIQIAGFDGPLYDQLSPAPGSSVGSYDVLTAMGTVAIDDLVVEGVTRKASFYIQGYTDMSGLTVVNSSVDTVSTAWGKPVIVDPMADQLPSGTPNTAPNGGSFFDESAANGSYDLSGLTVAQNGAQFSELDGTTQDDAITGTNANDQITGFAGNDTISGAGGDDTFLWSVGDGQDIIDGGDVADTDTFQITGSGDNETFFIETVADYHTRTGLGGTLNAATEIVVSRAVDAGVSAIVAELANIDEIVVDGVGGIDNYVVSGGFVGTDLDPSTITIDGSTGNDDVDITALSSPHRIVFRPNGGDDTVHGDRAQDLIDITGHTITGIESVPGGGYRITLENGDTVTFDGSATFVENADTPGQTTVNLPPVVEDDEAATDEDTGVNVNAANGLLGNDIDLDGGALEITEIDGNPVTFGVAMALASGALLTVNADGSYAYNPNGAFEALADSATDIDTFTYTVEDGQGGQATATATVSITGTNDAPVISSNGGGDNAAVTVDENTTAITIVNSTDVDGGAAQYSISGGADAAKFQIHANTGALTFLAAPDFETPTDAGANNVYDVQVQVADGNGGVDTQDIAVTVTDVVENVAPVAVADSYSTDEDTPFAVPLAFGVLANDTDGDGDTLHAILASPAGHGAVTLNDDGTFTYAPDANYSGSDSFTYTVNDGTVDGNTVTVAIDVAPVADAPLMTSSLGGAPSPDGAAIQVTNTVTANESGPSSAPLPGGGHVVVWAALQNNNDGTQSGVFAKVYDAEGALQNTIPIDAHTFIRKADVAALDGGKFVVAYSHLGSDVLVKIVEANGDVGSDISPAFTGDERNATVTTLSGGGFVVVWANANGGDFDLVAQRYASDGTTDGGRFTIVGAIDVDGTPLPLPHEVTALENGAFAVAYNNDGFVRAATVSDAGVVDVLGSPVDTAGSDPKIVTLDTGEFVLGWHAGNAANIQVFAADGTPGASLSFNNLLGVAQFDIAAIAGGRFAITWTGPNLFNGTSDVFVKTFSSSGTADSNSSSLVTNTGSGVSEQQPTVSTLEDGRIVVSWISGDDVFSQLVDVPPLAVYRSEDDGPFEIPVNIALSDTDLSEVLDNVRIESLPEGFVIRVNGVEVGGREGGPDSDWVIGGVADEATLADIAAGAQLEAVPPEHYNGDFDLTISATSRETANNDEATTTVLVPVSITPVNDAPVIADVNAVLAYTENQAATAIDGTITLTDVDDTDLDGATVTISGNFATGQDVLGFVNQNGITGSYNAATGVLTLTGSATKAQYEAALVSVTYFNTSDNPSGLARTVSYSVTDGDALSNVGSATVNVTPVNDAPLAVDDNFAAINEDTVTVFTGAQLKDNDYDVDSSPLYIIGVANGVGGTVTLNMNTEAVTFTPFGNYFGPASFTYTLSDGSATDTATVTFDILSVNDTPVLTAALHLPSLVEDQNVIGGFISQTGGNVTISDDGPYDDPSPYVVSFDFVSASGSFGVGISPELGAALPATNPVGSLVGNPSIGYSVFWSYSIANAALDYLNEGQSVTVTYRLHVTDDLSATGSLDVDVILRGAAGAPVVGNLHGDEVIYFEDPTSPVRLDAGNNVTITDVDSQHFGGGSLIVEIVGSTIDDRLSVEAGGAITLSGTVVSWNGTVIGTISGNDFGLEGDRLVISLNGNATHDATEALIGALHYVNTSHNPTGSTRAVTITLNDGTTGGTTTSTISLVVVPVNDAPVLTGDLAASVDAGDAYVLTAGDLGFTDPDDGQDEVTFTVTNPVNGSILVNGVQATEFTGEQLADGLVSFLHDASQTTAASFDVSVEDGNEDGSAPVAQTFALAVNVVPITIVDYDFAGGERIDLAGLVTVDSSAELAAKVRLVNSGSDLLVQVNPEGSGWTTAYILQDSNGAGLDIVGFEIGDDSFALTVDDVGTNSEFILHSGWGILSGTPGNTTNNHIGDAEPDMLVAEMLADSDSLRGNTGDDAYVVPLGHGTIFITDNAAYTADGGIDTLYVLSGGTALATFRMWDGSTGFGGTVTFQFDSASTGNIQWHHDFPHTALEYVQFVGGGSYLGYDLGTSAYTLSYRGAVTAGNDILTGDPDGDTISGGGGNDIIFGYNGDDMLNGDDGDDLLLGEIGNDILNGGAGNDTLAGGAGLNTMTGGSGDDSFVIDPGAVQETGAVDIITDFGDGSDVLDLADLLKDLLGADATLVQAQDRVSARSDGAGGTIVSVDTDGLGDFVDVVTLQGHEDATTVRYAVDGGVGQTFELEIPAPNVAPVVLAFSATETLFTITVEDDSAMLFFSSAFLNGMFNTTGFAPGTTTFTLAAAPGTASYGLLGVTDGEFVTYFANFAFGDATQQDWGSIPWDASLPVIAYSFGSSDYIVGGNLGDFLFGGVDWDSLWGGGGDDFIYGGQGLDDLLGGDGDDYLDGGLGDDDMFGGNGNDTLIGGAGHDELYGNAGDDILDGGAGNDRLVGGAGNDTLTGGAGADSFFLKWNAGSDSIVDFVSGTDKIGLLDNGTDASGSVNFSVTGNANGTQLAAGDFQIRSEISDLNPNDDNKVVVIESAATESQITAQTFSGSGAAVRENIYVVVFNSDTGRGEIWFDANWNDTAGRVKVATLENFTTAAQVAAITVLDFVAYSATVDPIVVDLDGDGLHFTAASFDLDNDGTPDSIGWPSGGDGLLVADLDGSGAIENGSEVFSPGFNGGDFANSLEALASLDSNGDGRIDGNDAQFADIKLWIDANGDGISDAGELIGLGDAGIAAINLGADAADYNVDGQHVFAQGTFEMTDGSTGNFFGLDLGAPPAASDTRTIVGSDGDDVLIGGAGKNSFIGGDGADVFVIDPSALTEVGLVDVITDYSKAEGDAVDLGNLLDAAFGAGAPGDAAAADAAVNLKANGGDTDIVVDTAAGEVVVAQLSGVHTAINILYDNGTETEVI
ncbi:MAG: tandem-95 repeat protein [Rhizobiaceae bacterium]